MALEKIQTLKKLLKTEKEQRKNAEDHFRDLIQERSQATLNHFTVTYLNKLHSMKDMVDSFEVRKKLLEEKRVNLKKMIESSLR